MGSISSCIPEENIYEYETIQKEKKKPVKVKEVEHKDEEKVKPKPKEKKQLPVDTAPKAIKIQAWWRGTLVRRTLLHAALRVWIIQCWWRKILVRLLAKKRRAILETYWQETQAAVKLQSSIRMWLIRQRYHRLCAALRVIRDYNHDHQCRTHEYFQGTYELTASQLKLQLDISVGSQICRITDCIPFPIKK